MLWIVEKIAKMWQMRERLEDSDNMDDFDHGPGYLLWTTYEYQLLDRLSEYAVNERDLRIQRFPDETTRETVLDNVFDVV